MRPTDLHHVACPHCGWSFVGVGTHDDQSTLKALRAHLETKHGLQPREAELLALVEAAKKTSPP